MALKYHDDSNSNSNGQRDQYYEHDMGMEPTCEDFDSPFEESVYDYLIDQGYNVENQVECAGYKIDLAILDPDNPDKYVLGIECDGATYHSSSTARERDKSRQEVLEGLGWKFH